MTISSKALLKKWKEDKPDLGDCSDTETHIRGDKIIIKSNKDEIDEALSRLREHISKEKSSEVSTFVSLT